MWHRLLQTLCGTIFALSLVVSGCVTMPDGSTAPDTDMISFAAVAAFTVIINETKVSDEKVLEAYKGLSHAENVLRGMVESGEPLDLAIVDEILSDAVPVEYKAIAKQGSKLIRSRARRYVAAEIPDVDLGKYSVVGEITLSVIEGAKAAVEAKASQIKK